MIESHDGKVQMVCDACPASFARPYDDEDFAIMEADARAAGWRIEKQLAPARQDGPGLFDRAPQIARSPTTQKPQGYTHTCPACRAAAQPRRLV